MKLVRGHRTLTSRITSDKLFTSVRAYQSRYGTSLEVSAETCTSVCVRTREKNTESAIMFIVNSEVQMYDKSQRSAVRSHDCCGSLGKRRHLNAFTYISVAHPSRVLAPSAPCDLHKKWFNNPDQKNSAPEHSSFVVF